jgi:hypothetical protein
MGTTIYDSSLRTQQRRSLVLYTYNRINNANIIAGRSVRREQPDTQLSEVVTYRHEVRANYTPTTGANADCPCSQPVSVNAGGDNSANVQ